MYVVSTDTSGHKLLILSSNPKWKKFNLIPYQFRTISINSVASLLLLTWDFIQLLRVYGVLRHQQEASGSCINEKFLGLAYSPGTMPIAADTSLLFWPLQVCWLFFFNVTFSLWKHIRNQLLCCANLGQEVCLRPSLPWHPCSLLSLLSSQNMDILGAQSAGCLVELHMGSQTVDPCSSGPTFK